MVSRRFGTFDLSIFAKQASRERLKSKFSINKFRNVYQRLRNRLHVKNTLDDHLLDATIKGNTRMATVCLEEGANADCHYEDMMTPLHIAAENGHEEMLEILIKYSSKCLDSKTLFGDTPLLIATQNENKLIMKRLLDFGAKVNCTDSCGRTPLHVAALKKKADMVKLLISYGAKVNTMDSSGEHVLCTGIITSPNPPVTYALLRNGANINCTNRQGMSLLSEAILSAHTKSNVDAVKMLLRRGANVNACNTISGQTPLHIAALTGNRTIVDLLLSAGADTKVKDRSGRTPRDIAIQYGYPQLKERMRGWRRGLNHARIPSIIKRDLMQY